MVSPPLILKELYLVKVVKKLLLLGWKVRGIVYVNFLRNNLAILL